MNELPRKVQVLVTYTRTFSANDVAKAEELLKHDGDYQKAAAELDEDDFQDRVRTMIEDDPQELLDDRVWEVVDTEVTFL